MICPIMGSRGDWGAEPPCQADEGAAAPVLQLVDFDPTDIKLDANLAWLIARRVRLLGEAVSSARILLAMAGDPEAREITLAEAAEAAVAEARSRGGFT